ncbi:hypothetical protein CONLIGDRAFT_672742 [Coniochaeta ligniaria NRRL 30616]|uniref:Uncharacterized protein n=1 Tax=Coniochaeta ligniaria NRRL 30616 TaxID=1408157 RepID=A0A1J7IXJ0_9PEZI|nr:hypothetical protein CONLIGDRAFT_672742 [Coniochaeta ligniaria NRRL 30616]
MPQARDLETSFAPVLQPNCTHPCVVDRRLRSVPHSCVYGYLPYSHMPTGELLPAQCYECAFDEASALASGRPEEAHRASLQRQWRTILHHLTVHAHRALRTPTRDGVFPPTLGRSVRQIVLQALRQAVPRQCQPDWEELEDDELAEFWSTGCTPASRARRGDTSELDWSPEEFWPPMVLLQYDADADADAAGANNAASSVHSIEFSFSGHPQGRGSDGGSEYGLDIEVLATHMIVYDSILRPFETYRPLSPGVPDLPEECGGLPVLQLRTRLSYPRFRDLDSGREMPRRRWSWLDAPRRSSL